MKKNFFKQHNKKRSGSEGQVSQRTLGGDINSFGIFDMKRVGGFSADPFLYMLLRNEEKGIYIISKFCLQNYIEFAGRKYIELAVANISTKNRKISQFSLRS